VIKKNNVTAQKVLASVAEIPYSWLDNTRVNAKAVAIPAQIPTRTAIMFRTSVRISI